MAESVGGVASRGRVGSDIVRFCVAVNINNRPSELSVSMGSNSALCSNAQALSTQYESEAAIWRQWYMRVRRQLFRGCAGASPLASASSLSIFLGDGGSILAGLPSLGPEWCM